MLANPHIETDRLHLRPFAPSDTDALHRLWMLPEARLYLWDDRTITREEAAAQIADSMACFAENGFGFWVVLPKTSPVVAGFAGLRRFGDPAEVELLYGLDPAYRRLGLATEAARAVLRFGFEQCGAQRIYAGADAPNAASFRVMERLGMSFARKVAVEGTETIYYTLAASTFRPGESYYAVREHDD